MDERGPGLLQIIQDFSENASPLDFVLIAQHWEMFAIGLWYTVTLVGLSLLIGTPVSLLLALARANRHPVTNQIIWCYTYVFRGTPLLVQLYLIYYGLGQFEAIRDSFLWPFVREAWWCTLLAFTLNTCAYTTEIFRGAIESVPFGEIEAAKACGMTARQRNLRVVLPNAMRRALPAYSNEVIFMLHGSVVASTVTIVDVLGAGRTLNARYYLAYEGYIAAAVIFMLLVYLISRGFKLWEHKWHAHLRPREA
jgi:arginine/ornithine transport system permease protein